MLFQESGISPPQDSIYLEDVQDEIRPFHDAGAIEGWPLQYFRFLSSKHRR
jgi:hypothetical protein